MENMYITVAYRLYAIAKSGEKELVEEAPVEHPFRFISGMGYTLEKFEQEISALSKGDKFEFTIPCAEAYGERDEENVQKVSKNIFTDENGKFDTEHVFTGNIVPLQDAEGHRFFANVGEITEDKVVLDFNHPHAGKDLIFEGSVTEMRPATAEEVKELAEEMSGGCGGCCEGGCGGCGGSCGGCH